MTNVNLARWFKPRCEHCGSRAINVSLNYSHKDGPRHLFDVSYMCTDCRSHGMINPISQAELRERTA